MICTKPALDRILRDYLDDDFQRARLRRIHEGQEANVALSVALEELESCGFAMRYLDAKRGIAWKATPKLRDFVEDLRLDAEADDAD